AEPRQPDDVGQTQRYVNPPPPAAAQERAPALPQEPARRMWPAAPSSMPDAEQSDSIFDRPLPPEPEPPMPPPREARRRSLSDVSRGATRAEKPQRTSDAAVPTSELAPGQPTYDRSQFDRSEPRGFEPEPPQDHMFERQARQERMFEPQEPHEAR